MAKVLFVTSSMGIGGNEKVLFNILNRLDKTKNEIHLLVLDGNYDIPSLDSEVKFYYMKENYNILAKGFKRGGKEALSKKKYGLFFALCRQKFRDCLPWKKVALFNFWDSCKNKIEPLNEEFDVAIAFGLGIQVLVTVDKIAAKRKIAWVNNDCSKEFDRKAVKHLQPYYASFDKVVAVTPAADRGFKQTFVTKASTEIIKDVFDENEILEKAQEHTPFQEETRPIFVTVGRISRPKGYHLLLQAAKIIKEKNIAFAWKIIGNGDATEYLQEAKELGVEDCVEFCGAKRNPYPYIKACDVYVQTSLWEGNCLTLIEAMLLERPIVTTNFPSALEKIEHGRNGLICEMTAESIAGQIICLLNDKTLQQRLIADLKENRMDTAKEILKIEALLLEECA